MIGLYARLSKGGFYTDLPLENEFDFFKLIYHLESTVSGTADVALCVGSRILKCRKLNKPPKRVFNDYTNEWYDFEYFRKHSFEFPLPTRFLYATFILDNSLREYGFF